jgi:hypothetical protein
MYSITNILQLSTEMLTDKSNKLSGEANASVNRGEFGIHTDRSELHSRALSSRNAHRND